MFKLFTLKSANNNYHCLNSNKNILCTSFVTFQRNGIIGKRFNSNLGSKDTSPNGSDILDESIMKKVFVDHLKLDKQKENLVIIEYLYDFNNTSFLLNKLLKPKKHILQAPFRKLKTYLTKKTGESLSDIHMVQTMRWTNKNLVDNNLLSNTFLAKFNNLKLFLGSTPITFHRINTDFKTLIIGNYFNDTLLPSLDMVITSQRFNSQVDFKFEKPIIEMNEVDNIVEIYNLSGLDDPQTISNSLGKTSEKSQFHSNSTLKTLYKKATSSFSDDPFTQSQNKDPKSKYLFIDCMTATKLLQRQHHTVVDDKTLKFRSKFTMKMETVFDIDPIAVFVPDDCTFKDKNKHSVLSTELYKKFITQQYPDTLIFDNLSKEQIRSPNVEKRGPLTLFRMTLKPQVVSMSSHESFQLHELLDCISNKPSHSIATNLKFVPTDEMYQYLKQNIDLQVYSKINCLECSQEQMWSLFEVYKKASKFSQKMNDNYEDL
ncbi:hypothetical protein HANVADRAFT_98505 [Hanseniaspora valbyensis NRRL Y-1626]|uniref:Uncharacterized protein n=1 Tax=Hanseniaspora valbyensis NRRL Y-1626 TaxID=766949 RepID=A0A1B7THP3_9ASCO|nr:hypothetical protein HANVADRAFT_98505 [Hanseniaspora valbyensis NRRL Y-1626]